jgi:hypothetical protein
MDIHLYLHSGDQAELSAITSQLNGLVTQGATIMANQQDLQNQVTALQTAATAQIARTQAREAAEDAQVAVLTKAVADLTAAAGTATDTAPMIAQLQSVIDSINAEDPTPPVTPVVVAPAAA